MPAPPFQVTAAVVGLISQIERIIGRTETFESPAPQPLLRKTNRIRTVQGSVAIEGNTLSLEQVTAVLEGKRVVGSPRELREVLNANAVYERAATFELLRPVRQTPQHRLERARTHFERDWFTRGAYLKLHVHLSTATGSRDLLQGVAEGQLERRGERRFSEYRFSN